MASPSSSQMVAEYAKSNRSACKKCSKPIAKQSLRVGMVSRDARGFDLTKWHHLDCFPVGSAPVASPDSITGFEGSAGSLPFYFFDISSDQEALKKLLDRTDDSVEDGEVHKSDGDEENEEEKNSEKAEVHKSDGDEENEEENNSKKAKVIKDVSEMVAEYAKSNRSSCKKCSKQIAKQSLRVGMSSDQEALKKLLDSSDKSVEDGEVHKSDGDEENEEEKNSEKAEVHKSDGDEENEKENNSKKAKVIKDVSEMVAEYAKSNRSSCKKCSKQIAKQSLRVGMVSRDARGFDLTKWHHLDCFPVGSAPVASPDSIKGFEALQSSDQEALKKLLDSSDKSVEDGEANKRDRDEENEEEKNSKKAKDSTHESCDLLGHTYCTEFMENLSSHGEASLEIAFSLSDVKDMYKNATLQPKWKAFKTIIFLEQDDGLHNSNKIAAFDFDGCLVKTSVKRVGADFWSLMYPSVPDKLQSLYNDGFKLVIFTNESNIERWTNKRQVAVDSKIGRLNNFIKQVKVPIQVFIACGLSGSSSGPADPFRKPELGMWHVMEKHFNSGISIDKDQSFYVGDAAGRENDHSDADIKFAQAIGLKFYVPEDYFGA
uniref:PARP-type domain-containing protein n=1 Tax=Fagus sylvatica TaxID=28930 RepID=A0A2N9F9V3_FAGSY